jgi:hypothetical protein
MGIDPRAFAIKQHLAAFRNITLAAFAPIASSPAPPPSCEHKRARSARTPVADREDGERREHDG